MFICQGGLRAPHPFGPLVVRRTNRGSAGGGSVWAPALAAVVLAAWPCAAQEAGGPDSSAAPSYVSTSRVPERWIQPRPEVLILPSAPGEPDQQAGLRSTGTIAKLPVDTRRLPEGYVIAARTARAEREGRWHVVHLDQKEGLPAAPPLRLLPNERLAMLETVLAAADGPRRFLVIGRVTEFQGVNYLILEDLAEVAQRAEPVPPPAGEADDPEPAEQAATPSSPEPGRAPTAEDILQQLQEDDINRAIVLPQHLPVAVPEPPAGQDKREGEAGADEASTWSEETLVVDRVGRVVPGEDWWMLAFEDRGRFPTARPIRLLPNRLLETAISLSRGGTKGVVFSLSGEVTLYKGGNYLLLRKLLVQRDLGNLR